MNLGSSADIVKGARVLRLGHRGGGEIPYFEEGHNIPFACKRVFYIAVDQAPADRGGHANSCDELIVALNGSVLIEVDNGKQKSHVRLTSPQRAFWIRAGLLIDLREFAPQTLLMVFASQTYADTRHFDRPQPHLLDQGGVL